MIDEAKGFGASSAATSSPRRHLSKPEKPVCGLGSVHLDVPDIHSWLEGRRLTCWSAMSQALADKLQSDKLSSKLDGIAGKLAALVCEGRLRLCPLGSQFPDCKFHSCDTPALHSRCVTGRPLRRRR